MRISKKGLYALEAMIRLAENHSGAPIKIHDIAESEGIPENFLELILLDLKAARMIESKRGANGGYQLRRAPAEISLGEIIRTTDGPLAPFGDAETLRNLVENDSKHGALYKVLLDVRDATSQILDNTTLADMCATGRAGKATVHPTE